MARFSDIIGQQQIKDHLQNALRTGNISHAYILCGERGSGKEFVARVFSMALTCERGGDEPCQECHSCKQALSGNQPDILWVTHEKPNSIGVEDIRSQINGDILIRPYQSPWKVYIIRDAEWMTLRAQNALLKTLEEPPAYGVILILTSNLEALLPTVVSRCVTLTFQPVPDNLMREYLMDTLKVPDYKADICVSFARGNIGRAKRLATSEDFDQVREEAVTLLRNIHDMEISDIVKAIKKITDYHMDVSDYLDLFAVWYRDVLLFKATNDANHLIFKQEIQYIKKVADRSSYEGLGMVVDALKKAKERLAANVNFDLTMELLLLTIQEKG